MPSIVTRPVITSMAPAIRLNWRTVVAVTWGWRQWKSVTISTIGEFRCGLRVVVLHNATLHDNGPPHLIFGEGIDPMTPIIAAKFAILKPLLDEQARRLWAAVEARALGRGGISQVAEATGLSRATVRAGLQELAPPATATGLQSPPGRLRRPGGGRKPLGTRDPHLVQALETLVDPVTRGDPMSLLRWTCKSAANLAAALQAQWHTVSERTVNRLLHDLGYSLQSNRKTLEGGHHPDRDAQFQYINRRAKAARHNNLSSFREMFSILQSLETANWTSYFGETPKAFQQRGQPVVSVDTKKKELIGPYRNGGQE